MISVYILIHMVAASTYPPLTVRNIAIHHWLNDALSIGHCAKFLLYFSSQLLDGITWNELFLQRFAFWLYSAKSIALRGIHGFRCFAATQHRLDSTTTISLLLTSDRSCNPTIPPAPLSTHCSSPYIYTPLLSLSPISLSPTSLSLSPISLSLPSLSPLPPSLSSSLPLSLTLFPLWISTWYVWRNVVTNAWIFPTTDRSCSRSSSSLARFDALSLSQSENEIREWVFDLLHRGQISSAMLSMDKRSFIMSTVENDGKIFACRKFLQ